MAPVKPLGVSSRHDTNPKTKTGVTGFHQEYNQESTPAADLNPDVVTEYSVLPTPRVKAGQVQTRSMAPKGRRTRKPKSTATK